MYQLLSKIYHKLSQFAFIRMLGRIYRNGFILGDICAYFRVKKLSNKKTDLDKKIKVVFLIQCMTIWNKVKCIYYRLCDDNRFEVLVLAIPDEATHIGDDNYKELCELCGEKNVINAFTNNKWFNIKSYAPDYVFYQRPYDNYLPKEYRSNVVSKYVKTCYLNYGYNFTNMSDFSMAKSFFRNIYIFFAENSIYQKKNIDRFSYSHKKGYRKSLSLGYPAFEDFMKYRKYSCPDDKFRIMWTPRWSEDIEVGGSNFFRYKDKMPAYVDRMENTKLIFRPHPMLFTHSIEIGKMTKTEVDNYISIYDENNRLEYDREMEYAEKFWNSDVLVTDFSSVIMEYYLTGKPIIYCPSGLEITDFFSDILSVNYVANDWDEIESILFELENGNDEKKEKRIQKIKEFLGDYENISKRIVDALYDDSILKK